MRMNIVTTSPYVRATKSGRRKAQGGFTFVEVLMAIVVLLLGIVAEAQLVPASIGSNSVNRNDSSALEFAQREMDQFLTQPLNQTTFYDQLTSTNCSLGNPAQPNISVGSPTVVLNNQVIIDFSASTTTGYFLTYQDPNDPSDVTYDVRWAVVTATNNGSVVWKRFIMGARKRGGNGIYQPVTIDTMQEK
jgi:type II secretory pathway pseudopilin PulG